MTAPASVCALWAGFLPHSLLRTDSLSSSWTLSNSQIGYAVRSATPAKKQHVASMSMSGRNICCLRYLPIRTTAP